MRLLMLGLTIGIVCAISGCQKVELQEFSPDGTFKVMMPPKPQQKDENFGGIPAKLWTSEYNDGAMLIAAAELPVKDIAAADAQNVLKEAQKGMLKETNATLKAETDVELKLAGKYPGRSFEATLSVPNKNGKGSVEGVNRVRIYLVGNKMFIMQALGKPDWVRKPEIDTYLDSLQITK